MKTYYIRLKSLSNLACETQEIKAENGHVAFLAGSNAAANWGQGNGSTAVRWLVEDFSGASVGNGEWGAAHEITTSHFRFYVRDLRSGENVGFFKSLAAAVNAYPAAIVSIKKTHTAVAKS